MAPGVFYCKLLLRITDASSGGSLASVPLLESMSIRPSGQNYQDMPLFTWSANDCSDMIPHLRDASYDDTFQWFY